MKDIEKARTQRDAKRTVASRRTTGSAHPEQSIVRHLGVEVYRDSHRRDNAADESEAEQSTAPDSGHDAT